jgi:hypothetical protein
MKTVFRTGVVAFFVAFSAAAALWAPGVFAAESCVAKCAREEAACIKSTHNNGQCASKAKACTAKCK